MFWDFYRTMMIVSAVILALVADPVKVRAQPEAVILIGAVMSAAWPLLLGICIAEEFMEND